MRAVSRQKRDTTSGHRSLHFGTPGELCSLAMRTKAEFLTVFLHRKEQRYENLSSWCPHRRRSSVGAGQSPQFSHPLLAGPPLPVKVFAVMMGLIGLVAVYGLWN